MDPEMVCASGLPKKDHERTVHTRDAGEVGGWVAQTFGTKGGILVPGPPQGLPSHARRSTHSPSIPGHK